MKPPLLAALMGAALLPIATLAQDVVITPNDGTAGFDGHYDEITSAMTYNGAYVADNSRHYMRVRRYLDASNARHHLTIIKFDLSGAGIASADVADAHLTVRQRPPGTAGTSGQSTWAVGVYTGIYGEVTDAYNYDAANPLIDDSYVGEGDPDLDFAPGAVNKLLDFTNNDPTSGSNVEDVIGSGNIDFRDAVRAALDGDGTITFLIYYEPANNSKEYYLFNSKADDPAAWPRLTLSPPPADDDMDGLPNEWETTYGLDPNDATGDNGASGNPDNDGLTNQQEYEDTGTNPTNEDTDGDTLIDGDEYTGTSNAFAPGTPTDPNDPDSDDDGADDAAENTYPTNPNDTDTDNDGMPDGYELACQTPGTALDPTTDDSTDDNDSDGLLNIEEYDPSQGPNTMSPQTRADLADTDDDGYEDLVEDNFDAWGDISYTGTDPTDPDSDDDGLIDGDENFSLGSYQGAGVTPAWCDPNDPDSDDDSFTDGYEVNTAGTDPLDDNSVPVQPSGFTLVEDFEGGDMVIGQTFDGVNGWSSSVPNGSLVQDEPIAGGDKVGSSIRLDSGTFVSLSKSLNDQALQILNGNVGTMFLQVYASGLDMNHNYGLSAVSSPNDFGNFAAQTALDNGGGIAVRPQAAFTLTGYNYAPMTWMNVWIVADNAADQLKVYYETPDGETGQIDVTPDTSPNYPFALRNSPVDAAITTVFLRNGNAGVGRFLLFDNIYVDPGAVNLTNPAAAKPAPAPGALTVTAFGFNGARFDITATGLNPAATYEMVRGTSPDNISTVVDTIVGPAATDTFSDTSPPADKAFYSIRDQ